MQNRGIISVCMRLSHLSEKFIGANGATMQIVPPLCSDVCAVPGAPVQTNGNGKKAKVPLWRGKQ